MDSLSTKLQFFIDLTVTQSKIKRKFDARLGINGVGLDDYIILYTLNKTSNGEMERSVLAKQIGDSITDLTRKLPKLEKIGLIKREHNPDCIKNSKIRLTDAGMKIHDYATESAQEIAIDLFPFRKNNKLGELINVMGEIEDATKART